MKQARAGKVVQGPTQATRLVQLAFEQHSDVWHDDQTPYIAFDSAGHREVHPLRSRAARTWLANMYFVETGTAAGSQALVDATQVIECYALQNQPRAVYVRLARVAPGTIYLDLGDALWRVVEVTATGWRVLPRSPVPFRRPRGLTALPLPVPGGSLRSLCHFLTTAHGRDRALSADQILTCAWAIGTLRGRGPYPILVSCGEQDSGKSTSQRLLRTLIDPNVAPLRSVPRNEHDLAIAASNAHVLLFDNLSSLRLSDELCRLASGAGFSTRTLFQDREEEIFGGARPIAFNGIVEVVERADLVSRCLFVQHAPVPEHRRQAEDQLWQHFENERPRLLGALLDIVAVALQNEPTVQVARLPRMADFAKWIVAAEPACPWEPGRFLSAYAENRQRAVADVLDDDPLVACLRDLLREHPEGWSGTATALLAELTSRTPERLTKTKRWYQEPRAVTNALRRLLGSLRSIDIQVTFDRGRGRDRNRQVHIERVSLASSAASVASDEPDFMDDRADVAADATDAAPLVSSADFANGDAPADATDDADAPERVCSQDGDSTGPDGSPVPEPQPGRHTDRRHDAGDASFRRGWQ